MVRTLRRPHHAIVPELVADCLQHAAFGRVPRGNFLHVFRRQCVEWAKLRSVRVAILAVTRELGTGLTGRLLDIAQADEPLGRGSGYKVDEKLVDTWLAAVKQLRVDCDTPLPVRAEPGGRRLGTVLDVRAAAAGAFDRIPGRRAAQT